MKNHELDEEVEVEARVYNFVNEASDDQLLRLRKFIDKEMGTRH